MKVSSNGSLPHGKRRIRTKLDDGKMRRLSVPLTEEEEELFRAGSLLMECSLCDLVRTLLAQALEPFKAEIEASIASTKAFRESIKMRKGNLN
jgi:hypothetical protein